MQTDYIIVGQGLCGTLLSYELMNAGKKVMVIDESLPYTAGKVASGLINPVTGMRVVKSWMTDELLPVAIAVYSELETELGISIMNNAPLLEFHPTQTARDIFNERSKEYTEHLKTGVDEKNWLESFQFYYGIGEVATSKLIDMRHLQATWRRRLRNEAVLMEEKFDMAAFVIERDKVVYKDVEASKIIFCDGCAGLDNPYFSRLPFALNKGEVLLARVPDLPRGHVYKQGLKIAPWGDDLFWVGSSFEWTYDDINISERFRERTAQQLTNWLKLPFEIMDHWASIRPATVDHKPFAGFHPLHPGVGILNGMGAKGCLQAPYFARSMAMHLLHGTPVHREADIARYTKILSR